MSSSASIFSIHRARHIYTARDGLGAERMRDFANSWQLHAVYAPRAGLSSSFLAWNFPGELC